MFGAELQSLCGTKDITVTLKRKHADSSSMKVQARSTGKAASVHTL